MSKTLFQRAHYHEKEKLILAEVLARYSREGKRSLLDVGCGTGTFAPLFQSLGLNFKGVDLNAEMLEIARGHGHHPMSLADLKSSGESFDIILMSHVIEHIEYRDLIDFIYSYLDHLKEDGYLILVSPLLVENFYYDFTHVRPYYPQAIWQMFGEYHDSLSIKKQAVLRLKDIYFIRDAYKTRKWRSYYMNDRPLRFAFTAWLNRLFAHLYLLSGHRIGPKVSWLGVYSRIMS